VLRNAADNPEGAGDIMLWVLGIIAFVAVMFVVIAPGIVWRVVQRGRELDGLALSGLREQAETHPLSFRATPENTTDIKIQHLDDETSKELSATLVFRHKPTGKWKIETVRTQDTGAAVRAFRQLFGPEAVAVDYVVEQRLKRMAGGDG
jgi:hypothetical protein